MTTMSQKQNAGCKINRVYIDVDRCDMKTLIKKLKKARAMSIASWFRVSASGKGYHIKMLTYHDKNYIRESMNDCIYRRIKDNMRKRISPTGVLWSKKFLYGRFFEAGRWFRNPFETGKNPEEVVRRARRQWALLNYRE